MGWSSVAGGGGRSPKSRGRTYLTKIRLVSKRKNSSSWCQYFGALFQTAGAIVISWKVAALAAVNWIMLWRVKGGRSGSVSNGQCGDIAFLGK